MTKTISSARCVVEFLKVMSSPLPTFGLPAKQQDENENPLMPSSGSFGISSEASKSKDLSAISSTPSTQSEAITASPPAFARNEGRSKDACFASPGDSPELVISGHIRHLGGSVDCTPMSSPREEQDEDEQEDLSMLQAQAAENWTAWTARRCRLLGRSRMRTSKRTCQCFKHRQQRTGQLGAVRGTREAWTGSRELDSLA